MACHKWEEYDCASLKPSPATITRRYNDPSSPAVGGMGSGRSARVARYLEDGDEAALGIKSYNEVMSEYRDEELPALQELYKHPPSKSEVRSAGLALSSKVLPALSSLDVACSLSDWDKAEAILRSPALSKVLPAAMNTARRGHEATVGMSWGACGGRHCGAFADVEESLGELRARMGLFEEEEARFCIAIARRAVEEVVDEVLLE